MLMLSVIADGFGCVVRTQFAVVAAPMMWLAYWGHIMKQVMCLD